MPDYRTILAVIETGIDAESPFYAETCEGIGGIATLERKAAAMQT
jgi:hypothetical protein